MTTLSYLLFSTSPGWVGILGSQEGLRKLTLPQPSPEQAWHLLTECVLSWHDVIVAQTGNSCFADLPQRIRDYFNRKPVDFPCKLDLSRASLFQKSVWQITQSIPYGQRRTYGWVADKLGMPKAARPVGQALAQNPLPIVIPCHRVVCNGGSPGGFSGGEDWKRALLKLEAKTI